jgi:hypothetical protein
MISAVMPANADAHARRLGALTPPVGGETAKKMAIPDPMPSPPMMLFRMSGRLFLGSLTGMRRMITRSAWYPESAADQSAPHRLATRLTLIHEEGRTGRYPRVLTDER